MPRIERSDVVRFCAVTLIRAVVVLVVAAAALLLDDVRGGSGRSWIWLVATAVVALAVVATRSWTDAVADRIAYGRDGDPYAHLSALVERVADTLAIDDVMPQVAKTVTQATHSRRSELTLWLGEGVERRQSWPPDSADSSRGELVDVALEHRGDQVGTLGLTSDREFSADDQLLIQRLAGTAGLALANVRLAYDLRRRLAESRELQARLAMSRQRLLDAKADETRRFARLVDERVQSRLDATEASLAALPTGDDVSVVLGQAEAYAVAALASLREIAAGVFPPTLDSNGLVFALESLALNYDGRVRVRASANTGRADPALEVAAYFCAVRVIDDCAGDGSVEITISNTESTFGIWFVTSRHPTEETVLLLDDRVQATHGSFTDSGGGFGVSWLGTPDAPTGVVHRPFDPGMSR